MPIDAPAALATREAMKDVLRFWLDMGCDGFRVDMADSLVKNDGDLRPGTTAVWRDILGDIHREYPDAAFVSEWNNPELALNCGFDMDFYLNWDGNGYATLLRNYENPKYGQFPQENRSYFSKNAQTDMTRLLEDYLPRYERTKNAGLWCFITGNHDVKRLAPMLDERERKLAFAFLFTMPGAPFLYYGDEIGMPYRWVPTKEGGYHRCGSRTPMQWAPGKNLGFSDAPEEDLYLPVGDTDGAPTVAAQERDPDSFLNFTRRVIALRSRYSDLGNYVPLEIYSAEKGSRLFAYKRGKLLLAVNPSADRLELRVPESYEAVFTVGSPELSGHTLSMSPQSFALLRPAE